MLTEHFYDLLEKRFVCRESFQMKKHIFSTRKRVGRPNFPNWKIILIWTYILTWSLKIHDSLKLTKLHWLTWKFHIFSTDSHMCSWHFMVGYQTHKFELNRNKITLLKSQALEAFKILDSHFFSKLRDL